MRLVPLSIVLACTLFLTGCKSDEERAAEHYNRGVELAEAGDTERAIVEFRNTIRLDENHVDGRLYFARLSMEAGNRREALRSYVWVTESDPTNLEAHLAVANQAALTQNWEAVERHTNAAKEVASGDAGVRVLETALEYRNALLDRDDAARAAVLEDALEQVSEASDSVILRNVLADGLAWQGDAEGAVEHIDHAISLMPEHKPLHMSKLSVLSSAGNEQATEEQLRVMARQFPNDENISAALVRFLVGTGNPSEAEAFLREISDPSAPNVGPYATLVHFIAETRGPAAAIAELDGAIEDSAHPFVLGALRAGLRFDNGQREQAISELEEMIAAEPPASLGIDLKVTLARMLAAEGDFAGARARVDEVLEVQPGQPEALRMQAAWLLEVDDVDGAVAALRSALDSQPEDVDTLLQLATAYYRAGNHDLSRDTLALAVSVSDNAPDPTLRYAGVLIEENKLRPAESVLVDALRAAPQNTDLLAELARIYLIEGDFARAQGVVDRLERIGTEQSRAMAHRIEIVLLGAQERTDDLVAMLEDMEASAESDARASSLLIRSLLQSGDAPGALEAARSAVEANPDDLDVRITYAATLAALDDVPAAVEQYRAIIDDGTDDARVFRLLSTALFWLEDEAGGRQAVADGLAVSPSDPDLLWMQASLLEADGDIDGAIAIYEELYDVIPNALVVANNLASLLSTSYGDDPEKVERAFGIARRLRGTEVPEFQDTYGWILHLRGQTEGALRYLEPAAAALPSDPMVQFHLGMALASAGRSDEAATVLEGALTLAGDDTRPQFEKARSELLRLTADGSLETTIEN